MLRQHSLLALTCAASIGLGGCVTVAGIDKGVATLLGQSLDQVFNRIGYPTAQREFEGRKLYVWSNSQNLPQTPQTTGSVYGRGAMLTYNETTTDDAPVPMDFECTVILEFGPDNRVVRYQWHGNIGGCERYAKLAR